MALNQPLRIDAGATLPTITFYVTNADGTVYDLTGYTAKMQFRQYPKSTAALALELTPTVSGSLGTVTVNATATQTASLTLPSYYYGIELTRSSDSNVIRLADGIVTVSPEVVY
jgi:hypothetical protein